MQAVVTWLAPIALFFLLCSTCTGYYEAILGWNTRSRCADQTCHPYVRLPFWRGEYLYHRPLGVRLFWYSGGEYTKNSVPWKRIHAAGRLNWCHRLHAHRKPFRRKPVSPFLPMFWGVYPIWSSALFNSALYIEWSVNAHNSTTLNIKYPYALRNVL